MVEKFELSAGAPQVNAGVEIGQFFHRCRFWVLGLLMLGGCASVGIRDEDTSAAPPPAQPPVHVYVRDFGFAIPNYVPRESPVETRQFLHAVQRRLTQTSVEQLRQDGFSATGLDRATPLPREGWLITGRVTRLFEGDRALRAVIGLGAGETHLQAQVFFYDLSTVEGGRIQPFYRFRLDGGSGNMPGLLPSLGVTTYTPINLTLIELPDGISYAGQTLRLLPDVQKDLKRGGRMINGAFQDYLVTRGFLDPGQQLTHPKRVGEPAGGLLVD